jgi:hypothetical protein
MRGRRIGLRHWKRWLALGIVALAVAAVGGPFIYIHFIEGKAPAPLALGSPAATSGTAGTADGSVEAAARDGTWTVTGTPVVGYRVKEVLFGQSNVAVGRTSSITGSITVGGTTITGGSFTVDMTTVRSD